MPGRHAPFVPLPHTRSQRTRTAADGGVCKSLQTRGILAPAQVVWSVLFHWPDTPLAEVFTPTDAMRVAIAKGITAVELRGLMKEAGHQSMRDAGMRLVDAGTTSLAELNRVLAEDQGERRKVGGKQRILIVDDDRMIRTLVKLLLERDGYIVLQAENGREGIDMTRLERPDLVITDLMMPDVDGYQVLTALREEASLSMLPVIVLTAETGGTVERTVLDLGADDYLVKPFDEDVLLQRVRSVFVRQMRMAS